MKSYLSALKDVSSLPINISSLYVYKQVADWQRVLMRGVLSLSWALAGGLVAWLISGERFVSALLGMIAVFVVRAYVCKKEERSAAPELSRYFTRDSSDQNLNQAVYLGLLLLRPACVFILIFNGGWLWLCIAAMLGYAAMIDCTTEEKDNQKHWLPAVIVSLVIGAFVSKIFPQYHGLFVFSIVAMAFCWLMPSILTRFGLRFSKEATLYFCETAALILGIAGFAM